MRRRWLAPLLVALTLALLVPATVAAHGHPKPGHSVFVAPHARVHGHAQSRLLAQWGKWVFGTPAETNGAIAGACAPSPRDKKVWFLPVSVASGESVATCKVPQGAYLLISPGGFECSQAEGNGSTREELLTCARAGFAGITAASVTVRGHEYKNLKRFVKVTPKVQLPGPNLFGPDPGPSLTKGYFLFIKPLKPGHHSVKSSIAFADGFVGGITYDIEVVKRAHH